jgi:hypothetical protein
MIRLLRLNINRSFLSVRHQNNWRFPIWSIKLSQRHLQNIVNIGGKWHHNIRHTRAKRCSAEGRAGDPQVYQLHIWGSFLFNFNWLPFYKFRNCILGGYWGATTISVLFLGNLETGILIHNFENIITFLVDDLFVTN